MKSPKTMRWLPVTMLLALATLLPARASAQLGTTWVEQRLCTDNFLSACATLHYVDFANTGPSGRGVLSILVSNTSDPAVELTAYIRQVVFDFTGTLPGVMGWADARYGTWDGSAFAATPGDFENWNAKSGQKTPGELSSGFELDLAVKDDVKDDQGGNKNLVASPGRAVMITINFDAALGADVGLTCVGDPTCDGWSAEMKGLGADGKGHGYTMSPEPATIFLLGSGLFGLIGVEAVRRRRRGDPGE